MSGHDILRQNLKIHVDNNCPLTTIDCDFKFAGCEERLLRKDMQTQLCENTVTHLSPYGQHTLDIAYAVIALCNASKSGMSLKGAFDDHRVWLFRSNIIIQLLGSHHTRYVAFDSTMSEEYTAQVVNGERVSQGQVSQSLSLVQKLHSTYRQQLSHL